ncbi:MAG TPA: ABC transporter substrate-binding protein [Syntrophomonadaceae bacterium]|nr:ABC transporter substrate-binding protein [Syntrophomonadaceae bacterium]
MRKNVSSRLLIGLLIMAMLATLMVGCSSNKTAPVQQTGNTRAFTDMTGKTINLPAIDNIERVAVLTSPQVQIMYVLGVQDKLCAMTASQYRYKLFEKFYPRQAQIPAPRAQAADMNVEALLASNPQFAIGSETDMDLVDKTTQIPTVRINTNTAAADVFKTRKAEVQMFGEIFGAQARAEKYGQYLDNVLNTLKDRTAGIAANDKAKVYLGFGADHLTTYGGDTYMQYQIEAAGCLNASQEIMAVAGKEGGLSTISLEHLLRWDPDVIVIDTGDPQALKNDPTWSKLKAVKNGKVYTLPVGGFIWNRPSCESAVLLPLWLGTIAYPDQFKDISMPNEVKKYWQEILGFSLTDDDVEGILNPPISTGGGNGGGQGTGQGQK